MAREGWSTFCVTGVVKNRQTGKIVDARLDEGCPWGRIKRYVYAAHAAHAIKMVAKKLERELNIGVYIEDRDAVVVEPPQRTKVRQPAGENRPEKIKAEREAIQLEFW